MSSRAASLLCPWALGATCLTLVLWAASASALDTSKRTSQYVRDSWTYRNGLDQHQVRAILQTHDGYLWLATESGLVRFDGMQFTTIDTRSGLPHDYVYALLETEPGVLWVGTYSGLARVEGSSVTTFTTKDGLAHNTVRTLVPSKAGGFWIGGDGGLTRYKDGRFSEYTPTHGLSSKLVRTFLEAQDGSLWIGTDGGGLNVVRAGAVERYSVQEGLPSNFVTALWEASDGSMCVGTNEGLACRAHGKWAIYTVRDGLTSDRIQVLREDAEGTLWVGTAAGLGRVERHGIGRQGKQDSIAIGSVNALYEDVEGSLWIGMKSDGLGRLRTGRFTTFSEPEGLSASVVWSVAQGNDGTVWIGTENGGLNMYRDGVFSAFGTQKELSGDEVRAIAGSRDGSVWLGTKTGLKHFKGGKVSAYSTKHGLGVDFVRSLHEDFKGRLWVGTYGGGLHRMEGGTFTRFTRADGLPSDIITKILGTRDGALLVGTADGLAQLREGHPIVTLSSGVGAITALYEDVDGTLWVGSTTSGLARLKLGHWTRYTTKDGLFDNRIHAIVDDGLGNLWMASDRGPFVVSKQELDAFARGKVSLVRSQGFSTADGLKVPECNGGDPGAWKTRDGRIWFATQQGVAVVDPADRTTNVIPPPVHIGDVVADGRSLSRGTDVDVPAGVGMVELRYAGLSFQVPERVRFRYKLEGFDPKWIEAGNRRVAYYSRLPPGHFRFHVVACNNDGVWNDTGDSLGLSVARRFYQTRWFYSACVLATALFAGALHSLRVKHLRARERELSAGIQEAMSRLRILKGLLPICAWCKQIRDDKGYWSQVEEYVRKHSDADFTHGICPQCKDAMARPSAAAPRRR